MSIETGVRALPRSFRGGCRPAPLCRPPDPSPRHLGVSGQRTAAKRITCGGQASDTSRRASEGESSSFAVASGLCAAPRPRECNTCDRRGGAVVSGFRIRDRRGETHSPRRLPHAHTVAVLAAAAGALLTLAGPCAGRARHPGHAAAGPAGRQRPARRLHLRRRPLGGRPRRQERPPADQRRRRRVEPRLLARRPDASPSAPSTTATPTSTSFPSSGGAPTRLTWHPAPTSSAASRPTARRCSSPRRGTSSRSRYTQLFTVPLTGGMPTQLPIPHGVAGLLLARRPAASPTRRWPTARAQWKHYRGGTHSRIWIYRPRRPLASSEIPQPAGRCNDLDPKWIGETVYFRSDRNGEYNLFAYDTADEDGQATDHARRLPGARRRLGRRPADLRAGRLPAPVRSGQGHEHAAEDRRGRPTWSRPGRATSRAAKYIRNAGISPSGARAVFEFRGEIVTVPAEKGDPRNLTESPGVHDRSPAWSPDGRSIAWFSDEGGEYRLARPRRPTARARPKIYDLHGAGFYESPVWSPDSQKIAYIDNSQSLFWIDLDSGQVREGRLRAALRAGRRAHAAAGLVARLEMDRLRAGQPGRVSHASTPTSWQTGKSRPITDGLSDAVEPVFDAGGKYLYFFASTDAGPVNQWFAQSAEDMRSAALDLPGGAAARACRRRWPARATRKSRPTKADEGRRRSDRRTSKAKDARGQEAEPKPVVDRLRRHRPADRGPARAGRRTTRNLQAGPAGQVFYLEWTAAARPRRDAPDSAHAEALRPRQAQDRDGPVRRRRLPPDAPTARRPWSSRRRRRWSIVEVDGPPPARRQGQAEDRRRSRSASTRGPSGSRSSTRPGGSTATISTIRACTAPTGRPCRQKYAAFLPAPGHARRPRPRHPVDAQRAGGRPQLSRARRAARRAQDACPAGCSGPTTRWPTAATASRRSTAG